MTTTQTYLEINWEDPQLVEKASAFFLDALHNTRKRQLALLAKKTTAPAKAPDIPEEGDDDWHLGLDNLPEEFLPAPQFLKLTELQSGIRELLNTPFSDAADGRQAAREIMFRRILHAAGFFIDRLLFYLLFDKRFHPECRIKVTAINILRIGNTESVDERRCQMMQELFTGMKLCNLLNQPTTPNGSLAGPLAVLRDCGGIFFMTIGAIFPVQAVSKCHMSFSMMMDAIGYSTSTECVDKFIKHMKAMQRAIEDWSVREGTISPNARQQTLVGKEDMLRQIYEGIQTLQTGQQASANAIAKMDRRQRDLFKFIKSCLAGFIKLFRPEKPKPTREQVQNALLPPDRYACLSGIKEPHRSQVKAVIDYTYRHPIVFKQQKGDGYTLSNAVRDTWREHESKWALIPGTFPTVDDLRTACYNQQEGPNDPFCYQT